MISTDETQPPTRREARRQDRRAGILDVASQSFLEQGYAGTTMSAIAAALGGSKGTLWSYFPSKEELFAAVIEQRTTDFRAALLEILNPSGDLEDTLRIFCTSFITKITAPDAIALHRLAIAEAGRSPAMGRIFYDRGPQLIRSMLGDFLSGAMTRGQLRAGDAVKAARSLISLCFSGCHQHLLFGVIESSTPELIQADAELAIRMFMRAYGAKPAPRAGVAVT